MKLLLFFSAVLSLNLFSQVEDQVNPRNIEERISLSDEPVKKGGLYLVYSGGVGFSFGELKNSKGENATGGLDLIFQAGLKHKKLKNLEVGVEAVYGASPFIVPMNLQLAPYGKLTLKGFYVQGSYRFLALPKAISDSIGSSNCVSCEPDNTPKSYLFNIPMVELGYQFKDINIGLNFHKSNENGYFWGLRLINNIKN